MPEGVMDGATADSSWMSSSEPSGSSDTGGGTTTDTLPAVSDTPVADPLVADSNQPAVADAAPQVDTPAAPQAEPQPDDDLSLTPAAAEEPLTVKALNDKIAKSPELQAALSKDSGLRNLFYSTARLAAQAGEFKQVFQTPELARSALDLANKHIEFENIVTTNPAQALEALYSLTAARDANGEVLWDQPNPQYVAAMTGWRETNLWGPAIQEAAALGNQPITLPNGQQISSEDLRDAVAIVATYFGDKVQADSPYVQPRQLNGAQGPAALPAEVQERLDRLDQLEQQNNTYANEQRVAYHDQMRDGIHTSVTGAATSYLDNLQKANPNIAITDFIKQVVLERAVGEIYALAKNDQSYQNHINFIFRSARVKDADLQKRVAAEATKYARERLPKLISKHLGEASKGVVATEQRKAAKQLNQAQRPEVQGNAGVPNPSRQDPAQRVREFITKNKRKPTDIEILDDRF
jgi:hypothetical protein